MTGCFCKGQVPGRECYGAVTDHHVIPRQAIRRQWRSLVAAKRRGGPKPWSVTDAIADPRNKVDVCFGCHLGLVETGKVQVEPHQLHRDFWCFVRQYDLQASVPRHLAERWAA